MSWYSKQFANGRIAFNDRGRLEDFKEVFEAFAATRRGAAIFARKNSDGSVTAYLTPPAEEFALMIQAAASSVPAAEGLMLLCGDVAELQEARRSRDAGSRTRRA